MDKIKKKHNIESDFLFFLTAKLVESGQRHSQVYNICRPQGKKR